MEETVPQTPEQQMAQILLGEATNARRSASKQTHWHVGAALGVSLLFLLITWHKSGFSWAASNVLLSDFYVLTLAVGNPWRWLFHHSDPDFHVSATSRTVSWLFLLGSLALGLILTPSMLNGLQSVNDNLQQAQQLQQELGN